MGDCALSHGREEAMAGREMKKNPKYPVTCPVCNGTMSVPLGFYTHQVSGNSTSATPQLEPCRSCDKGIHWIEYEGFTKVELIKIRGNKKYLARIEKAYNESKCH